MPVATTIALAIAVVVLLVIGRFLFGLVTLIMPIAIAGIVLLFVLDKARGGTAIEQLAAKISTWLKGQRFGG